MILFNKIDKQSSIKKILNWLTFSIQILCVNILCFRFGTEKLQNFTHIFFCLGQGTETLAAKPVEFYESANFPGIFRLISMRLIFRLISMRCIR